MKSRIINLSFLKILCREQWVFLKRNVLLDERIGKRVIELSDELPLFPNDRRPDLTAHF